MLFSLLNVPNTRTFILEIKYVSAVGDCSHNRKVFCVENCVTLSASIQAQRCKCNLPMWSPTLNHASAELSWGHCQGESFCKTIWKMKIQRDLRIPRDQHNSKLKLWKEDIGRVSGNTWSGYAKDLGSMSEWDGGQPAQNYMVCEPPQCCTTQVTVEPMGLKPCASKSTMPKAA